MGLFEAQSLPSVGLELDGKAAKGDGIGGEDVLIGWSDQTPETFPLAVDHPSADVRVFGFFDRNEVESQGSASPWKAEVDGSLRVAVGPRDESLCPSFADGSHQLHERPDLWRAPLLGKACLPALIGAGPFAGEPALVFDADGGDLRPSFSDEACIASRFGDVEKLFDGLSRHQKRR